MSPSFNLSLTYNKLYLGFNSQHICIKICVFLIPSMCLHAFFLLPQKDVIKKVSEFSTLHISFWFYNYWQEICWLPNWISRYIILPRGSQWTGISGIRKRTERSLRKYHHFLIHSRRDLTCSSDGTKFFQEVLRTKTRKAIKLSRPMQ